MNRLLSQLLRNITPPMLRSDSPNRPMVVRRKHWFLQETRFLFLTRRGPVEITVKPALILGAAFAGFVGTSVIAAATLFVGYKSVEVVTNESITTAEASAPPTIIEPSDEPPAAIDAAVPSLAMPATDGENSLDLAQTTRLAIATTPPPVLPPVVATDEPPLPVLIPDRPVIHSAIPFKPLPSTMAGLPHLFLIPQEDNLEHDDLEDDEAMFPAHLYEPDMMIPVPPVAEIAMLSPSLAEIAEPKIDPVQPKDSSDQIVDNIAMMALPQTPSLVPSSDGLDMLPDATNNGLPVFNDESRERKLLRSMAREVRGIRQSLAQVGLPEAVMPDAGSLQGQVESANFAGLAMSVEDHRSMLRKVPLKPPMLYFYISSDYGWRTHPVLKKRRFHHGIDLAGTWQETVHAPAPGTVIFAGRKGSFGKVVQIRHAYGVTTTYAHLAKITIRKGADVVAGTVVGKMGRTGRVDGAHLHYEIRIGDKSLDPQLFFDIGHRIGVGGELMLATDTD